MHGPWSSCNQRKNGIFLAELILISQIEVKRAQPKGREREQGMSQRSFDQSRSYGGSTGTFGGQNGFSPQQGGMMNPMYGGMTPALMAQWYQRMQAYYATMGRGMMPGMGMNQPMMGGMPMPGMPMGGMPQQMMGMPQQPQPGQQQMGYQPMSQGFVGSPPPPQQPHHFQQEPSSHEGEYTYDTGSDQGPSQHSPPPMDGVPSGPREGPPPNAPTGPSGLKPSYGGGGGRGRGGMMRGVGRGYGSGSFPGGMARGGNVRYNPYAR